MRAIRDENHMGFKEQSLKTIWATATLSTLFISFYFLVLYLTPKIGYTSVFIGMVISYALAHTVFSIFKQIIKPQEKKWCGCGDELRSKEDLETGMCWICRSVDMNAGRNLPALAVERVQRE